MSEMVVNVPINISKVKPDSPGKIVPVLASRIINHLSGNHVKTVAIWNTGQENAVIDCVAAVGHTFTKLDVPAHDIDHEFDDHGKFHAWCRDQIDKALSTGGFHLKNENVLCCTQCGNAVVLAGGQTPENCAKCNSNAGVVEKNMPALTIVLPHSVNDLEDVISTHNLPQNWKGQIVTLPEKILASKPRNKGLALDFIGLEGVMLDPRFTNVMMLAYQAETKGFDKAWGVLASGHMNKVAPYYYAFKDVDLPKVGLLGISKVPVDNVLADETIVGRYGIQSAIDVLAIASLTGKKWENEQGILEIKKYCRRNGDRLKDTTDKHQGLIELFSQNNPSGASQDMMLLTKQAGKLLFG